MKPLATTAQWFTAVMGTAIVATSTGALPFKSTLLWVLGDVFWIASVLLLIAATTHMIWQYSHERGLLRDELHDPARAPFFGALAMAPLAVGGATLAVGPRFLGADAAVALDQTLWVIGTALAITVAIGIPALQFTSHRVDLTSASPAWMLPVVAPMVSAATGAMMVDRLDNPVAAQGLAFFCLAMFGASLIAAGLVTATLWWKLSHHQHADASTVPALWIVLGPLGQSVTAITMLAVHAPEVLGVAGDAIVPASVLFGVPVMGFALLWLGISATVALRVAGRQLPYSMTWWSFTFPVGTCVTGASGLAAVTGAAIFGWLALGLFALLLAGWAASAIGTVKAMRQRRRARAAYPEAPLQAEVATPVLAGVPR
ncbi:hypothetical protein [Demequina flava]|uniref:SLAC1 family transporter n=1 Tax=Demequina flava TaxID=1095025 RepID=UPI000782B45A|nr:hypothetical protein [Demequina flava]